MANPGPGHHKMDHRKLGFTLNLMRAELVMLLLAPGAIAANQPAFTYAVPANAMVAAMTVDAAGNTYLTGSTSSSSLPTTAGALQTQFGGGNCSQILIGFEHIPVMVPCTDAFVIKLDPAGNVVFATYFGGSGSATVPTAIRVDASGNVYLGGITGPNAFSQPDTFPVTPGAVFADLAAGGEFVAKLNAAGTGLVYSTLLPVVLPPRGGGVAMAVDPAGDIYIATTTV